MILDFEKWKKSTDYVNASQKWPRFANPMDLWIAYFFDAEPSNFMSGVTKNLETMDAAAQTAYKTYIHDTLLKAFTSTQIQEAIAASPAIGGNFLINYFPEFNEWWQSFAILVDLEQYLKNTLTNLKSITEPAAAQNYAREIKRLLKTYAPEGWENSISAGVMNEFMPAFYREEIGEIQAAEMEAISVKNKKIFGFAIIGGLGLFALSALMRRK